MALRERFSNSWRLMTRSLAVVRDRPRLLVFPLLSAVCMLLILLFFLAPVVVQPTGHGLGEAEHWEAVAGRIFTSDSMQAATNSTGSGAQDSQPMFTNEAMMYLAVLYFVGMFGATFFNVAFYHEILAALRGEEVRVVRGLQFAVGRLRPILLWSLCAGIVGYLIKMIEERVGALGRIVVRLIGFAWSVASVFAIPVIVMDESVSPLEALRRSAAAIRSTWGEAVVGFLGFQIGGLLIGFGSLVLFAAAISLAVAMDALWLILVAGLFWLIAIFIVNYVLGVAAHVYRTALYLFASSGKAPGPYEEADMALAWKTGKR